MIYPQQTSSRVGQSPGAREVSSRRRGFTFTEIMFAVVILGIGFIMIAAVFPVAIRMNAQSAEETQGAVIAQRATQVLQSTASDVNFAVTSTTLTNYPPLVGVGESVGAVSLASATATWSALRSELVSATDARNGFAVAYARSGPASNATTGEVGSQTMKVIIVTAQVRGERQRYNDEDGLTTNPAGTTKEVVWGKDTKIPNGSANGAAAVNTTNTTPATLQFKRFEAAFALSTTGAPDRIRFTDAITGDLSAAGEGAFVIIANVNPTNLPSTSSGPAKLNGRVFRLGRDVSGTGPGENNTYELVTGQDVLTAQEEMDPNPSGASELTRFNTYFNNADLTSPSNEVEVLVLGKMLRDASKVFESNTASSDFNPYVGLVQDISVYSTVVGIQK